ncbi:hypothetical protein [Lentzea kentuckyensis]|uniref:hypothetical protein n=1 Tax=Lentzea kentuckyensis TaxID=360086 RepID=UPI000A3B120C|nr:hypothetical protein [Lentzea kentuckyensis]
MTEFEKRLVGAAQRGELLVCPKSAPAVPAELIRELLLGAHGELDPRGVRIEGARIKGVLDLENVTASVGLYLTDCTIDEPIDARDAHLRTLVLSGGRCAGLQADGVLIDSDLYLHSGLQVDGDQKDGLIRLSGSHIGGDLSLRKVELTNASGPAIEANRVRIDGSVFGRRRVRITGNGWAAAFDLQSAHIEGDLLLDDDVTITNAKGPALDADDVRVQGSVWLTDGFRATGHGAMSAVSLENANVILNVKVEKAEITNEDGTGFNATSARVSGHVLVRNGTRISGRGPRGAIDLAGAHVGGSVLLENAEITNDLGAALNANGIDLGGSLFLHRGAVLTGRQPGGAIDLVGGHLAGDLDIANVTVTNSLGPAVSADQIKVDGRLFLSGKTSLSAAGRRGALTLHGGRIGGQFDSEGQAALKVLGGPGPVLNLQELGVGTTVTLPPALRCGRRGNDWTCVHHSWVRLDGLSYASLGEGWDWQQWLHLIRHHTLAYHASAYQRLAAVERAAGHDGTVRRILMTQQTDLRRRNPWALGGPLTRWFHWLWGVLAGYGYRARRTAAALLLVLAMAGLLGWSAGQVSTRPGHLAAERVASATTAAGVPCSTVELVGLGLDRGLPLGMTGMRARCDLDTAARAGQAFTAAIWLVQLAVWGLATLALAGYTNLVRKPG